jgi:hypothetical protein
MKAAASAEASLTLSAATSSPEQVCSTATNAFELGVAAAMAWARGEHEGIATIVATRGAATGAVSATGFIALEATNETNAVDLGAVAADQL